MEQKNEKEGQERKYTFREVFSLMPHPLTSLVVKQMAFAVCILLLSVVMLITSKQWFFCSGVLIALLFSYMGLNVVWKYADNKIFCQRMVICKAKAVGKQRFYLLLRDAQYTKEQLLTEDIPVMKSYLTVSGKDKGSMTEGTIMDVYAYESSPYNIMAWEIIGSI